MGHGGKETWETPGLKEFQGMTRRPLPPPPNQKVPHGDRGAIYPEIVKSVIKLRSCTNVKIRHFNRNRNLKIGVPRGVLNVWM